MWLHTTNSIWFYRHFRHNPNPNTVELRSEVTSQHFALDNNIGSHASNLRNAGKARHGSVLARYTPRPISFRDFYSTASLTCEFQLVIVRRAPRDKKGLELRRWRDHNGCKKNACDIATNPRADPLLHVSSQYRFQKTVHCPRCSGPVGAEYRSGDGRSSTRTCQISRRSVRFPSSQGCSHGLATATRGLPGRDVAVWIKGLCIKRCTSIVLMYS
jgi:hypothetical protein